MRRPSFENQRSTARFARRLTLRTSAVLPMPVRLSHVLNFWAYFSAPSVAMSTPPTGEHCRDRLRQSDPHEPTFLFIQEIAPRGHDESRHHEHSETDL